MLQVLNFFRQGVLKLFSAQLPAKPTVHCNTLTLGDSEYGAWTICPTRIARGGLIYSFGIGEDISWDLEMIDKFDVTIHAFDPTPRSADFIKRQNLPKQFVLHEYGIADYDGMASFYPPENPEWVSHTLLERKATSTQAIKVPVRCLKTIMLSLGHERIDMIKMDIEGAEYAVISDMLSAETAAGGAEQLLVEFHHRFGGKGIRDTKACILELEKMGFSSFHISPTSEEWSFLRCV